MKLTKEMTDEAAKRFEELKKIGIFAIQDEKSANESPEEQKKYNDIKKNLFRHLSKGDILGAKKYLENVRPTL